MHHNAWNCTVFIIERRGIQTSLELCFMARISHLFKLSQKKGYLKTEESPATLNFILVPIISNINCYWSMVWMLSPISNIASIIICNCLRSSRFPGLNIEACGEKSVFLILDFKGLNLCLFFIDVGTSFKSATWSEPATFPKKWHLPNNENILNAHISRGVWNMGFSVSTNKPCLSNRTISHSYECISRFWCLTRL